MNIPPNKIGFRPILSLNGPMKSIPIAKLMKNPTNVKFSIEVVVLNSFNNVGKAAKYISVDIGPVMFKRKIKKINPFFPSRFCGIRSSVVINY